MKVKDLIKLLKKLDPEENMYVYEEVYGHIELVRVGRVEGYIIRGRD